MPPFTIIGHRGACAHEPENTLRSIRRAIADGADMVEIDVRWAAGELVVIHDDTLGRTTDGEGSIYDKSFEELRALDAGNGETIPTLAEVLDLTHPELPLNIEIKDTAATAPTCQLLRDRAEIELSKVLISSFHDEATREARATLPEVPIGILAQVGASHIAPMFTLAAELGAASVHPPVGSVSREFVGLAHAAGYRVLPYTARTAEQLHHLIDSGADGCFADDPKWAAQIATPPT